MKQQITQEEITKNIVTSALIKVNTYCKQLLKTGYGNMKLKNVKL